VTPAEIGARLRACGPGLTWLENEPLARHTTIQVGGPADWLVDVRSPEALECVLKAAEEASAPVTLLGGGSNVVVSDDGLRGVVLRVRLTGLSRPAPDVVRAEAGVTMNGLVRWLVGQGLAGLEAWAGTPGTVGGAIFGNAHYAGRNIGDHVREVRVVTRDGRSGVISRADMAFGYDVSRLQTSGEILMSADFEVRPGDPTDLRAVARASLAHRKRTQPLALPSAGCMFQNPDPGRDTLPPGMPASAGALVDRAVLKGFRVGGAAISNVHANFVVNDGHATARDIHRLTEAVRRAVRDQFGVDLRNEVVFLGHF
jgi:UDP-N-acetylmuramate dehydrogenase